MPRHAGSPYRYDRATIRFVVEREGVEAARARWPRIVVDPIARSLSLLPPYHKPAAALTPEQISFLGTEHDSVLAARWNLPHSTVSVTRRNLGIQPLTRATAVASRKALVRSLSDADLCAVLTETAAKTGLPNYIIAAERRRRGVRATSRRGCYIKASLHEHRAIALTALRSAFPSITLEELGAVFGLTRERVRQLELINNHERKSA